MILVKLLTLSCTKHDLTNSLNAHHERIKVKSIYQGQVSSDFKIEINTSIKLNPSKIEEIKNDKLNGRIKEKNSDPKNFSESRVRCT
ncbi:hypothetical protein [Bacillus solimangrovi]|uniref:hypothetical protein n=1 Tax=Bacillus solimangrovi TaxID=1305675 RepID=UPI001112FDD8|nr:hypothetical protein [Bacillus solimangrovi]